MIIILTFNKSQECFPQPHHSHTLTKNVKSKSWNKITDLTSILKHKYRKIVDNISWKVFIEEFCSFYSIVACPSPPFSQVYVSYSCKNDEIYKRPLGDQVERMFSQYRIYFIASHSQYHLLIMLNTALLWVKSPLMHIICCSAPFIHMAIMNTGTKVTLSP